MSGKFTAEEQRILESQLMRLTVVMDQTTNSLLAPVPVGWIGTDKQGRPRYYPVLLEDPVTGKAFGTSNAFPMGYYNSVSVLTETQRTPTLWKSALISANGSTAIWTSAAGKKARLMGIRATLVNGTTAAAACLLKVLDVAADTGIGVQICGAAMGAVGTSSIIVNENYGNGYLMAATNTAININLSSVLAVAGVFVQVWGTEE